MLGVWAFVYALLHLTTYLVFDQLCYSLATCDFQAIWDDILKRRFIFVGQFAFAILLILALTSTTGWMRRLKKNWTRLHRLVYVAAIAGDHPLHLDSEVGFRASRSTGRRAGACCWGSGCLLGSEEQPRRPAPSLATRVSTAFESVA